MEKQPSWGRNIGGRGQHVVPLYSSLGKLRLVVAINNGNNE